MSDRQRILVMRHPQTVANIDHVLSGRSDVDLTEEGVRQLFRSARRRPTPSAYRARCTPIWPRSSSGPCRG